MKDYLRSAKLHDFVERIRYSRVTILVIVYIAILLDNMLLTTVVPIIPEYVFEIQHPGSIYGFRSVMLAKKKTTPNPLTRTTTPMPIAAQVWNMDGNDDYEDDEVITPPTTTSRYANKTKSKSRQLQDASRVRWPALQQQVSARRTTTTTVRPKKPRDGTSSSTPTILKPRLFNADGSPEYTPEEEEELERIHEELLDENLSIGFLFSAKPIAQVLFNLYIGPLTNRVGFTVPMFCGFVVLFLSSILFAFGSTYFVLFVARAMQGVGSSCTSVSGMAMLAQRYPDDRERGNAMAIALGGLAMGVLVGPPFGGAVYQFLGKTAPFIFLSLLAVIDGLIQFIVLRPEIKPEDVEGAPLSELLHDPYVLIATGAITFANVGIAMLEPSLPLWMMDTMQAEKWQLGAAFLPCSISYLIGTNIFGPLGHQLGRWRSSMIGLILCGFSLSLVPSASTLTGLIIPMACLGFAIGMVDSTMFPIMGHLVDLRHTAIYGSVYAIADVGFCIGFSLGPIIAGLIVKTLGFAPMLYIMAVVSLCYAPLCYYLKDPPARAITQPLISGGSYGYATAASAFEALPSTANNGQAAGNVRYVNFADETNASAVADASRPGGVKRAPLYNSNNVADGTYAQPGGEGGGTYFDQWTSEFGNANAQAYYQQQAGGYNKGDHN